MGQSSWDVALVGAEQAVCTPRCELRKLLERWAWRGAIFPLPSPREGAALGALDTRSLCPALEAVTTLGVGVLG